MDAMVSQRAISSSTNGTLRTAKSCGPGIPTLMPSYVDDQRGDGGQKARCTEEITYKS
jgi:hypothetical protein